MSGRTKRGLLLTAGALGLGLVLTSGGARAAARIMALARNARRAAPSATPAPAAPAPAPVAPAPAPVAAAFTSPGVPISPAAAPNSLPAPGLRNELPERSPGPGNASVRPSGDANLLAQTLAAPAPPPARFAPQPRQPHELAAPRDAERAEFAQAQRQGVGVWLSSSVGVVRRSLDFSQDVYGRMRTLGANVYVYRLGAELYPSFRLPALEGRVGLIAGYEGTFTGSVRDADFAGSYPVTHSELFGGVRVRRVSNAFTLGGNLTLGRFSSGLDDHGAGRVPDITYTEARTALDATFQLPYAVSARLAAGFRVPLAYGEISDTEWFPRVGGYGFDLSLDAAYPLSRGIALTASASLRRFVLEMNSEPEDAGTGIAEVAGGAVDSYLAAYLGVVISP